MTKANTMHKRRKFKKQWPCQKFQASVANIAPVGCTTVASFALFHCFIVSTSTANATDPQIHTFC